MIKMCYWVLFLIVFLAGFIAKQMLFLKNLNVGSHKKVESISAIIKAAGITYLLSQLKILLIVEVLISIFFCAFGKYLLALSFFAGAMLAWFSGFLSMYFSVTYNCKVALAAQKGYDDAFSTAFSVGKVISLFVVGIAFLSCYSLYLYALSVDAQTLGILYDLLIGFSFGASLIAVFARIGGGIFTKGADIGADLVGKVEKNIPEDDPRNPAVIADALGDNIGDACGMSADIFQTFVVLVSSAILFILKTSPDATCLLKLDAVFTVLLAGIVASMLVLARGWSFKLSDKFYSMRISIKTFLVTSVITYIVLFSIPNTNVSLRSIRDIFSFNPSSTFVFHVWFSSMCGAFFGCLVMLLTEYYTSSGFRPVDSIVDSSTQGSANNVIQGVSIGYSAVFFYLICIVLNLFFVSLIWPDFGIAYACLGMISVAPVVLALDAFGPITDNAGGLVEMGELDERVRDVTDKLDSIGNMTKATTKGYAVFTAGLSAFVLSSLYIENLIEFFPTYDWHVDLQNLYVLIGLLLGVAVVALFVSCCLVSVNNASMAIMTEVRRQFNSLKILEGIDLPNYDRAIDLLTQASLKEMIFPSLLPLFMSLGSFFFVKHYIGFSESFLTIAGFVLGVTIAGILCSISMTISGGAWDNAKKCIEASGKKHSPEHQAAVIGDTVGDPYKDTAGPAINPLIKLVGIIGLLLILFYKDTVVSNDPVVYLFQKRS